MSVEREALVADLLAHAPRYHFVQAVRILSAALDEPLPGAGRRPEAEGLRLAGTSSFAFAPADLEAVDLERREDGAPRYRLTARFLSLLGSSSVLPHSFTERLRGDPGEPQPAAAGFVDLLHHRLLSLAFRVLTRTRPFEDRDHPLYRRAAGLIGLADDHPFAARIGLFGGLIGPRTRGPKALEQSVRAYFAVPCRLQPLASLAWPVAPERRSTLGRSGQRLGRGAMLGRRRRQPRRAFALRLGPLPADRAGDLLPGGERHRELRALIARFNRDGLHCRVTVGIDGASLPVARLDRERRLDRRVRLGGRPAPSYDARFDA